MIRRTMKMTDIKKRETEDGKMFIEGYFAKFDEPYEVWPGWIETIAAGAFTNYLKSGADVKVIWNHNPDIVMGSTANGTATLVEDKIGLRGTVEINPADSEAVNGYERVKRGDVSGCSFGFDIKAQEEIWEDDGTYKTRITEVDPLWEVSPCTFPAYESTTIEARNKESFEEAKKRKHDVWKSEQLKKLKGE